MNSTIMTVICFSAFAISIFISYKKKLNTGLLSMAFAYLIGCFLMNLKVSDIIDLFPVRIMFLLFSVCLFYGYAIQNGTMNVIADHIIYRFRKKSKLLPFVLYILSFGLTVMGASPPAISSFLAPICIIIGESTGIHYLIMLVLISLGSSAGSLVPWGQGGLILRGILETSNYKKLAIAIPVKICFNLFITGLIALVIIYIVFKAYKTKALDIQKPVGFNCVQKKTLLILCFVLALVMIPSIMDTFYPNLKLSGVVRILDIQMLSILGAVICSILKLGDERKVLLEAVPWNTIVLVSGVCMLFGVVTKTGLFDSLIQILDHNLSEVVIGCLFILLAGFMSFFSGAMSVVIPLLLPIAIQICSTGLYSVTALASAITIGAVMTCMSPFSTAGSFILSCIQEPAERDKMFGKQFLTTCLLFIVPIILMSIGFYSILE